MHILIPQSDRKQPYIKVLKTLTSELRALRQSTQDYSTLVQLGSIRQTLNSMKVTLTSEGCPLAEASRKKVLSVVDSVSKSTKKLATQILESKVCPLTRAQVRPALSVLSRIGKVLNEINFPVVSYQFSDVNVTYIYLPEESGVCVVTSSLKSKQIYVVRHASFRLPGTFHPGVLCGPKNTASVVTSMLQV